MALLSGMIKVGEKYLVNIKAIKFLLYIKIFGFAACFFALLNTFFFENETYQNTKTVRVKNHVSRRNIYDRNGIALAASVVRADIYVHPNRISNKEELALRLSQLLKLNYDDLLTSLKTNKKFAVIAKNQNIDLAQLVTKEIKQPTRVNYEKKVVRYYKFPKTLDPFIGRVSYDGKGLYGFERFFENQLASSDLNNTVRSSKILLTIDSEIQSLLDQTISAAFELHKPKAIFGAIFNGVTGEILAYSQLDKEPQIPPKLYLTELVFEPGSTFKPFTLAIAIDRGVVGLFDKFFCHNGRFRFGPHTIRDVHPYGYLDLTQILTKSSNICTGIIALRIKKADFWDYISNLNFGKKIWNFSGESRGILFNKNTVKDIDQFVSSFGHGIAVTPIQLVQAFTTFLNFGYMVEPVFLLNQRSSKRKIFETSTALQIKSMLITAVTSGTGKSAAIPGYVVGGKTGTALKSKINGRGYEDGKYISSFIGFIEFGHVPVIGFFVVDEPSTGEYLGGKVAAPIFKSFFSDFIKLGLDRKLDKQPIFVMYDSYYPRS